MPKMRPKAREKVYTKHRKKTLDRIRSHGRVHTHRPQGKADDAAVTTEILL